jgi:hypothetical protein
MLSFSALSRTLPALAWVVAPLLSPGTAFATTPPELVLGENVRLQAKTPSGTIVVNAGDGIGRTYEWNGCTFESMSVSPRSERWYGSKGLKGEGSAGVFSSVFSCKGVSRPLFQESQLHFPSIVAAQGWLARHSRLFDTVWTQDGLVVQWGVSPERYQIYVNLTQICVGGQRPDRLAGDSAQAIELARASGSGPLRQECVQVGRAIEQHTERLWEAHWKQADLMNARHGQPASPTNPPP